MRLIILLILFFLITTPLYVARISIRFCFLFHMQNYAFMSPAKFLILEKELLVDLNNRKGYVGLADARPE
jgi:hypothetical protein